MIRSRAAVVEMLERLEGELPGMIEKNPEPGNFRAALDIALNDIRDATDVADEARVRRWIEQQDYALEKSAYGMAVQLVVRMPVTAVDGARDALRDITQGRAVFSDT